MTPLFLQFHHVPLYLEWAPIGVFGTAPQKKDSQPEQPAEKAEVEQETVLDPEGEKALAEGAEASTGKMEEGFIHCEERWSWRVNGCEELVDIRSLHNLLRPW